MIRMNIKPFINIDKFFIISSGRTGTEFFGRNLNRLNDRIYSIHEPDRLSIEKRRSNELFRKLKNIGFYNLLVKKSLGTSGTRNLSLHNIQKEIKLSKIIKWLYKDRKFINFKNYKFYFEANWQLFGLIPELLEIPNTKIIIIIRDPRDWVRSWMNKGSWYDNKDLMTKFNFLGFKRITPKNVGVNNKYWKHYNRFRKLCWVWNYMNNKFYEYHQDSIHDIRLFFFEDIFIKNNQDKIRDFLKYSLSEQYDNYFLQIFLKKLQTKVNKSHNKKFPEWKQWNKEYAKDLQSICGKSMKQLGYGTEPEWKQKLK